MIQRMNKYAFLVFHREYHDFLVHLQELGVVHIQEQHRPSEIESLQEILQQRRTIQDQLRLLLPFLSKSASPETQSDRLHETEVKADCLERIPTLLEQRDTYEQEIQNKLSELSELRPWGDFSFSRIRALEEAGYKLSFYTAPSNVFEQEIASRPHVVEVSRVGSTVYFVALAPEADSQAIAVAEAVRLPQYSYKVVEQEVEQLRAQQKAFLEAFAEEAPQIERQLKAYDLRLQNEFNFGSAEKQAQSLAEDKLILLEGWLPAEESAVVEQSLNKLNCYYKQLDVTPEDKIPVKLRNNSFVRLFEVITGMFSLPNYGEIDQTALLAPFFMLFFGLCFGDSGYGLLLFLIATFIKFKKKRGEDTSVLSLMQWLGGTATLVGLLSGSVFGVVLPYASKDDYIFNQDNMMYLSVGLGLLQIFFAKGVAAYKIKVQLGIKYALAPIAWLLGLLAIGAYIILGYVEVPMVVNYILYVVIGVSFIVAFFYNMPGKNPLLNFGAGIWNAYNVASGLLGDSLSYIRLFAIGLTGGILGGVFNSLAFDSTAGMNPFLRFPLVLIILLIGHGLNIGLAMIGAFVHPLRLTFVEYYKNSEFEGGGKPYTPFKQIR